MGSGQFPGSKCQLWGRLSLSLRSKLPKHEVYRLEKSGMLLALGYLPVIFGYMDPQGKGLNVAVQRGRSAEL